MDGWFICSFGGGLYGNGHVAAHQAGGIGPDGVVTMEADLDAGTLKFWLDGKPHGPGYMSGVRGRMRWAICSYYTGNGAQIVPTPELEAWQEWDGNMIDKSDGAPRIF